MKKNIKKISFKIKILCAVAVVVFVIISCSAYPDIQEIDNRTSSTLHAPHRLNLDGAIFSWNPISAANGYTLKIECIENSIDPKYHISIAGAGISFNLATLNLPNGNFSIRIRANKRESEHHIWNYSDFSEPLFFAVPF